MRYTGGMATTTDLDKPPTGAMPLNEWHVPDIGLPIVRDKIAAMNRRARRDVVKITVHDNPAYDPALFAESGSGLIREIRYKMACRHIVKVWAVGFEPLEGRKVLGAWEFGGDEPIRIGKDLPEGDPPDPRHCDHCGKRRARKLVFAFDNGDGTVHWVGSSCLKDMSGTTVANMLWLSKVWAEIVGYVTDGGLAESWRATPPTEAEARRYVAGAIAATSKQGGYVKVSDGGWVTEGNQRVMVWATRDLAWDFYGSEQHLDEADRMLAWAAAITGGGDFDHNLRAVGRSETIGRRSFGVAAYLPTAYAKAQVADADRAEREAQRRETDTEANDGITPRSGDVPTGRHEVTGRVLSTKIVDSDFGATLKGLIRCGDFDLWGTVPTVAAEPEEIETYRSTANDGAGGWVTETIERKRSADIGELVRFRCTIKPSDDRGFGFYTRPAKAEIVGEAVTV